MDTRSILAALLWLGILGSAMEANAGVPDFVAFTARLTNNGVPVNGPQTLEIRLMAATSGGSPIWSEAYPAANFSNGQVYLSLGVETPGLQNHFDGSPRWFEVVVNGQVMSPRLPVVSVPYAFRAVRADEAASLSGLGADDVVTQVNAGTGLSGGGAGGQVSLSVNTGVVQSRVTGSCQGGSAIRSINGDGSVACETDDDSAWPGGHYCILRAGGSCPGGFSSIQGQILAFSNYAPTSPYVQPATFGDSSITCHGVCGGSPPYNSDLRLAVCCK
jgi:hypothetical protein